MIREHYQQDFEPQLPKQIHHNKARINTIYNNQEEINQQINHSQMMVQAIRIHALEKLNNSRMLWSSQNDKEFEQFFLNYEFYEELSIKMQNLLQSKTIKLIKNQKRFYFGQVCDNKKHGIGIIIYRDGKIYEGSFNDNQKNGLSFEIYPNGNVYIGQYLKNKKHGLGSFYWFTINSESPYRSKSLIQYYQGEWWAGLPEGKGLHRRANGDVYQGQFKNGLKHGEGYQIYFNQDTYKGAFSNGLPEGYGQYIWVDGCSYKGDFKHGLRNGFGIWKNNKKQAAEMYRGHYLMDKRSGYGVYTSNNQNYKGQFFEDHYHGYGQLYHKNILIYSGEWNQGQRVGQPNVNKLQSNFRKRTKHHFSMIQDDGKQIKNEPKKNESLNKYNNNRRETRLQTMYTTQNDQEKKPFETFHRNLNQGNILDYQKQQNPSKKSRILKNDDRLNPQKIMKTIYIPKPKSHQNCIPKLELIRIAKRNPKKH